MHKPKLELIVIDGRVFNYSNKLQSWGRRKRMRFKDKIYQHNRLLVEMHRQPDRVNINHFKENMEKCARLVIQEKAFWKQRVKMHWLKEADMNTKFFSCSLDLEVKSRKLKKTGV